jgi:hypothetical protein
VYGLSTAFLSGRKTISGSVDKLSDFASLHTVGHAHCPHYMQTPGIAIVTDSAVYGVHDDSRGVNKMNKLFGAPQTEQGF